MKIHAPSGRLVAAGALCLLIAVAAVLGVSRAEAHGVQVSSDPPPNAQIDETPPLITVTFNEPIEPSVSSIQLWDQSAQQVELGALAFPEASIMTVQVPGELSPGFYTVIWRNLSTVDGHTWSGSFPITIAGPGGELPDAAGAGIVAPPTPTASNNPSTLESASRWVVLLGSAVMLGGTAYVLLVVAPAARVLAPQASAAVRGLSRTVLLMTVTIAGFLVLEGSLLQIVVLAERLGGLGRADELLLDTRLGHYLIARQGLLAVAALAVGLVWWTRGKRGETPALLLLLTASFGVLLTQSLVSHAAASDGPFWTTSIDVLHLLAASLWVGGLIHIGLAMPRWLEAVEGAPRTLFAGESFRRFSILAVASVVALLASGVLSALVQFTSWDELWSTSYGWSLIGKLAVMLPLLAVGGLNAFILQPRVVDAAREMNGDTEPDAAADAGDDEQSAVGRLQRLLATTVRAEAVLGIAVLVAVAVLIQLQSPRTAAEAEEQVEAAQAALEAGGFQLDAESAGLDIALRIEPGRLGENSFELALGAGSGDIGEVQQVRLQFDHDQLEDAGGARVELEPADGAEEPGFRGATEVEGIISSLEIEPAQVGENSFEVGLGAEFGSVGEVEDMVVQFNHEDGASFSLPLLLAGSLRFVAESSDLSVPGEWTATVTISRLGQDEIEATFEVPVSDPSASRDYVAEGSYLSLPGDWTITATVRRSGQDDLQVTFDVPISESGLLTSEGDSGSIWQWPFEGGRSVAAIATLSVLAAGLAGWRLFRFLRPA